MIKRVQLDVAMNSALEGNSKMIRLENYSVKYLATHPPSCGRYDHFLIRIFDSFTNAGSINGSYNGRFVQNFLHFKIMFNCISFVGQFCNLYRVVHEKTHHSVFHPLMGGH